MSRTTAARIALVIATGGTTAAICVVALASGRVNIHRIVFLGMPGLVSGAFVAVAVIELDSRTKQADRGRSWIETALMASAIGAVPLVGVLAHQLGFFLMATLIGALAAFTVIAVIRSVRLKRHSSRS